MAKYRLVSYNSMFNIKYNSCCKHTTPKRQIFKKEFLRTLNCEPLLIYEDEYLVHFLLTLDMKDFSLSFNTLHSGNRLMQVCQNVF